MRKFLSLIPAVGALLAMSHVNAALIAIDPFGGPDMFVADTTINGVGVSVGPVGPVNPPANTLSRTVTHELLAGNNSGVGGASSNLSIGSVSSPAGAFTVFNDVDRDSQVVQLGIRPAVGECGREFPTVLQRRALQLRQFRGI
jgi:hypothetical protein